MEKNVIVIDDFNIFVESLKAAVKLVDSAKFLISPTGLEIYGVHDNIVRCELTTNAIHSNDTFDFCIDNLSMLNRVLSTAKEVHGDCINELELSYVKPNLIFKSKKMKTKYSTCIESAISKWISHKLTVELHPIFRFKTSSDLIKRINGHSFMFTDSKSVKVYIETKSDMENNAVFATLGDRNIDLGKEMTLKLGLVVDGSLPEGKALIVDIERMNMLNCIPSNDISIDLMDKNVLLSNTKIFGKDGVYFNLNVYCTLLKG